MPCPSHAATREGGATLLVIDASALLAAFLPEETWEPQADALLTAYQDGRLALVAPRLLVYEMLNSLYIALRGKAGAPPRLTETDVGECWQLFVDLGIQLIEMADSGAEILRLASEHKWQGIYDLAYVVLAQSLETKLVTADAKLARAFGVAHPLWEPLPL